MPMEMHRVRLVAVELVLARVPSSPLSVTASNPGATSFDLAWTMPPANASQNINGFKLILDDGVNPIFNVRIDADNYVSQRLPHDYHCSCCFPKRPSKPSPNHRRQEDKRTRQHTFYQATNDCDYGGMDA